MTKTVIGPKSPKQQMMLSALADTVVCGGAAGCFDEATEYLTLNGWKKFAEYENGELVAQYDANSNSISFVEPEQYIKLPSSSFKRIKARGLDFCLTPEHRIVYWGDSGTKPKVISYEEMLSRHNNSKVKGFSGKIKTTFSVSAEGIPWTEGEIRLQVAVQADGRVVREGKDNYTQMRFSKERKYLRLLDLCKKFGLRYKDNGFKEHDRYLSGKAYEVIVWPKTKDKIFSGDWWKCSQEQLEWIADEVQYWDSNVVTTGSGNTIRYCNIHKENADFIQYAFHACGYNTSISVRDKGGNHNLCYTVNATKQGGGFRGFANKDGKAAVEDYPSVDGFKYCFTVPSGMLLVRRSDKIFISGNSGKSFIALLYPLKYANDPYFRGIIFRKTTAEITAQGGLWENAVELYRQIFGNRLKVRIKDLKITFPSGASLKFSHLEQEQDKLRHQGAQYSFILFDEGTHFSQTSVEYLGTRLRSARARHKQQIVITCNPDPDSFLLEWVKWYLNEDGTPDLSKDGVVRYYVLEGGKYIWADKREELEAIYGTHDESGIMSFTFISATCYDNPVLLANDPTYISKLKSKPWIDVQRLLLGNWLVRPSSTGYWKRDWAHRVDYPPTATTRRVRAWDISGTVPSELNPNPDWTAGTLMSKDRDSFYYVEDVVRDRRRHGGVFDLILETARHDGHDTLIVVPCDPGAAGKAYAASIIRDLAEHGYYARMKQTNQSKVTRFAPFAAASEAGNVRVVLGDWNEDYFKELEAFDGGRDKKDDQVDSTSDAFFFLNTSSQIPTFHLPDMTQTNPLDLLPSYARGN